MLIVIGPSVNTSPAIWVAAMPCAFTSDSSDVAGTETTAALLAVTNENGTSPWFCGVEALLLPSFSHLLRVPAQPRHGGDSNACGAGSSKGREWHWLQGGCSRGRLSQQQRAGVHPEG